MSAFIVEKETIDKIVYFMSNNSHLSERYNLDSKKGKNGFGEKLLRMNIEAVNQRYNENDTYEDLFGSYNYSIMPCNIYDAYKSLQCLKYQSSEDNVPDWSLYKELEYILFRIANDIVTNLPAYETASWG